MSQKRRITKFIVVLLAAVIAMGSVLPGRGVLADDTDTESADSVMLEKADSDAREDTDAAEMTELFNEREEDKESSAVTAGDEKDNPSSEEDEADTSNTVRKNTAGRASGETAHFREVIYYLDTGAMLYGAENVDGTVAYCFDPEPYATDWPSADMVFTNPVAADKTAAYIIAKGYPNTTYISGVWWDHARARMITQVALWYYRCDQEGACYDDSWFSDQRVKDAAYRLLQAGYAYNGSDSSINHAAVIWMPPYSAAQRIITVSKNGKITLKKVSANSSVTNGSECYSLDGAQYGVYSDSACKNQAGILTTNANGDSNTITVRAGTYYVKEIKAPRGFALDKKVYTVTVNSGQTAAVNVADNPTMDPVGVLLKKVDKETDQNEPQGSASLAGALFEVKFYKGVADADPAQSGKTAERSWIFRTDEEGVCKYESAYLESGDELYVSTAGNNALPLGTVTIQEQLSPEGYLLNPEVYVIKITSENDGSELVNTYNIPVIPENSLNLNIVKKQKEMQQAIPGTIFHHLLPDGSTEEVATDENGKAVLKGLTWGEHTVWEVSVPDGFTVNPGKVKFDVEKGNKISMISNTATDEKGSMTFTVQNDGSALLEVEDTLAPYELLLHKRNQSDKALEGAEFTLYSDKKCTEAVSKGTTKADGTAAFSELTVGTTYYLKETKAPQGYQIPVRADGSDVVYEIRTESAPLTNRFEYYVDGKKYMAQTGSFAIAGTKAERIVNLTVLNDAGVRLPETGSYMGLIVFLSGMACMAGVVVYYLKKRKNEDKKNEKK